MKRFAPWLGLAVRLFLGGVLGYAGYLKAFNPSKAKMAVRAYEALPVPMANLLGILLPWCEIGLGIVLILGVAVRYASFISAALMLLFVIAIAQAALRGLSIDCGCFGGGGQVAPGKTKYLLEIARDTGLIALSLYLFRYPTTRFALEKEGF